MILGALQKSLGNRIHTAFFLLAVASAPFAFGQDYKMPANGRLILPLRGGKKIFDQCSRHAPAPTSDLWEPTAADIAQLEGLLPKFLAAREKSGRSLPPKGKTYHRQYVGFIRSGERYIYANFYPLSKEFASLEAKIPIQVCDGGAAYWGVVYRVKTKTFEEPAFNGQA